MTLEGKVALVTGSSQGIGQAIAIRLTRAGAKVVINYRSHSEGAEETVKKAQAAGGDCTMIESYCDNDRGYAVGADLGLVEDVQRLVAESIDHYGQMRKPATSPAAPFLLMAASSGTIRAVSA